MRLGVMFPPNADPADVVGTARLVEETGFDFLACGEHLFFHIPTHNAFVSLAAAAAVTSRVRLLSALTILPVYPAALAAKQAATVDRISNGRFDLGVGVGGEFPPEFAAAGVPVRERGRRTDEALALLRELFTGQSVDLDGRYATIRDLSLAPPPVQPGGPPIWIGGRKEPALRRTALHGDVWFPYAMSAEQIGRGNQRLRELCADLRPGREIPRTACFGWGAVGSSGAEARAQAIEVVSRTYQQDFAPIADRCLVAGSPAEMVDRLGAYADQGTTDFLFAPAADDLDAARAMVELFADQVLPQLPRVHSAQTRTPA